MLRLILGKAGAGKTAAVIGEIRQAVERRQGGNLLLVPEQYSHEAERELCLNCGDSLSLYAEVFSFTGLARRIMQQQGGGAASFLDKGGRLLCMALALRAVGPRLCSYPAAQRNAELQAMLLRAVDEMKAACVTADMLEAAAESCGDGLGDKLRDLALISSAYDAVVARGHADPMDRLSILAAQIPVSALGPDTRVYVDGFVDFTAQERAVLSALLHKGVQMTVCLTVDDLQGSNEIYALSRIAARRLMAEAKELGTEVAVEHMEGDGKDEALRFFADNLFSYSPDHYGGDTAAVRLHSAGNMTAECEFAADRALELVRDKGCRWRDIALAIRNFEDYRGTLESVFHHYGVPLFAARRSELLSKPLPALIAMSYEIVNGGWDVDDVISYMRTGLAGLDPAECDTLADYIFKWQLRGSAWERPGDWRQHPAGYGAEYNEVAEERLWEINTLRRRLAAPLLAFQKQGREADTAEGQAAALAELFRRLQLPQQLSARAETLAAEGQETLAAEHRQLWDLIVSALEQCAAILGDTEMDMAGFGSLFTLMLSQYDVGVIPVSLDRVSAGDFDRMRRRSVKHLIVLGCSDDRLPQARDNAGVFSDEERRRLLEMEIDLGADENELWREFNLIYNCLTLPSEGLDLCYALSGADGERLRPAFVFKRAQALFGRKEEPVQTEQLRLSAAGPALTLAANAVRGGSGAARAAADYFRRREPERFARLEAAAQMSRGRLSPAGVEALYGSRPRLSASRIDKFASCKFAYFCQYGLRAKPYEPAGFHPPEIGTFMHYVLENTAREVKDLGGFAAVSDETLEQITDRWVKTYVHEELNDFQEKSSRFVYLFRRLCGDVRQVVADMAQELRCSDFEPLDFELDFSKASDMRPLELGEGQEAMTLTGIADRVDGWLHEGKLYLRVVDYKTGRKEFDLSEVWYGMGLQMLLYLFALEKDGRDRYGAEIVPAGVMYVPARNAMLSLQKDVSDLEAEKKRAAELRRSGLVVAKKNRDETLDETDDAVLDEALVEAWEKGEDKRYIPVRFRSGKPAGGGLASAAQLGRLEEHIRSTLAEMAAQLHRGSIAADPYYRSQQENACLNCDFFAACHFSEGENGESRRFLRRLSDGQVWGLLEGGGDHA